MKDSVINLRSDTQTMPTPRMREAMATAPLGDETYGEDPTVRRFEEMAADVLGKEAALLTLSGTMSNLIALMVHCAPSSEIFVDAEAHVLYYESGGLASVAGVVPTVVPSLRGHLLPDGLEDAIRPPNIHYPRSRLVWLENTHNRGGGSVMPMVQQRAVERVAKESGLAIHLDGARLLNAAAAQGLSVHLLTEGVDSVMVDLSKGLSCPLGSVLLGSREFVEEARFRRRILGGGMRQAGVIAACGIVAFEDLLDRTLEDHARAQRLAGLLSEHPQIGIDPATVETNMVYVDVSKLGPSAWVVARLLDAGVLVSERPPDHIRIVLHLQITDGMVEEAARRLHLVASESASRQEHLA